MNEPLLNGNEKKYLNECIDTGWISSEGPFVGDFERKFSNSVNRQFGVAVANGTAALEIAVKAIGISQGDEVILPTFTIISCAAAVVKAGGVPVLVDCDPETWNMQVDQLEDKITSRTKAIMAVHIYGLPVDLKPVLELAEKYGLYIIEDAAEAIGQTYWGDPCGSFGNISVFSFYPNKHITTGEGGMLVTDDKVLAERCRTLRNLCFKAEQRFVHDELGWNYRFTNLQAAVGLAQLKKLDQHLIKKREIGRLYDQLLREIKGLRLPLPKIDYADNLYWVFGLVLVKHSKYSTEDVTGRLKEAGIGTRPFFWSMHEQPVFKKMGLFANERYPNSEYLARNGFYLPSGLGMTIDDVRYVSDRLLEIISQNFN